MSIGLDDVFFTKASTFRLNWGRQFDFHGQPEKTPFFPVDRSIGRRKSLGCYDANPSRLQRFVP